ncbi:transcription factor PIF5-like isoform X2 [Aristolochia californica]|uniref:transcription factor PIF5-like isoform X2 n=1 Tax=Aristolochia californica TaxID=171875 RepID=UPI0035E2A18C
MLDIFNSETDFPSILRTSPDRNLCSASDLWQEFQLPGMRNSFFPPFSSSFFSSGNEEAHMAISDIPNNLQERSNTYGSGFFIDSQVSNHLHLGSFCPLPTVNTSEGLVFLPGDGLKTSSGQYENTVHSRLVPRVCAHDELLPSIYNHQRAKAMESTGKRTIRSDSANYEETMMTACKKKKAASSIEEHQRPMESSSSSHIQPMKAPLRRNHKLGDRVTALQQLVSPFGKTDTASVLQEATVYIKLLQEQIQVLSNPYFRFTSHSSQGTGGGEDRYDLRSRGLCLVPVSSTLNLAKEAGSINPCPSGRNVISRF